ncbi:hypothetical protein OsJ_13556 [Oryza sativa Japonica Group]|uniref:Uncharacterized protein n=1 Tax=Oryza sativa subsp. japonica TaxID=39947 RepID=B9FD31_ORYSJ|nr:hypothetical protein OsJ_13556 [Oryza sativa Japonica Group]
MVHCPDWWKSTTPPRAAQALPLLAPSRGAGAGASHRIRPRRRLLSPQMSPPPPVAAEVAAAAASRRICTCRLTGSAGAASLCSPVPAPPPFLPRCTTSAQPSLLPTASPYAAVHQALSASTAAPVPRPHRAELLHRAAPKNGVPHILLMLCPRAAGIFPVLSTASSSAILVVPKDLSSASANYARLLSFIQSAFFRPNLFTDA